MKILAIDFGEKRIGLALGDTETNLALPYGVLINLSEIDLVNKLKEIILEEEIKLVIIGEPISLTGNVSEQTKKSHRFADKLKKFLTVEVLLFDERLTSRQADNVITNAVLPTHNRDELAAMFLLQDYLERQNLKSYKL